jgi:nicotinamide riboside kinase
MKIALTGSTSTGKTTLVRELYKNDEFKRYNLEFLTVDARSILDSLGFKQMDLMTKEQTREFQKICFRTKKEIELGKDNFIVDRSFIDVASYWLVREWDYDMNNAKNLIDESRILAWQYDLHFYFPYGIIPFEADGYRSNDENQREAIDIQIKKFLIEWNIDFVSLNTIYMADRVNIVIKEMRNFINSRYE